MSMSAAEIFKSFNMTEILDLIVVSSNLTDHEHDGSLFDFYIDDTKISCLWLFYYPPIKPSSTWDIEFSCSQRRLQASIIKQRKFTDE